MKQFFTSHLFVYDGSGTPKLIHRDQPLSPGSSPSESPEHGRVFLAGGFPELAPDPLTPLSPTLQLNSDLGTFSQDELSNLASCELARTTTNTWRSYTLEADPRVVVLGDSAQALDRFIEAYGGVLNIEPILLKGYHPEYTTASKLDIHAGDIIELQLQVRTPIHLEKCSYCGQCGPVCPEDCLSETLFLNLNQCTFCNACVTACPQEAINLHSAEDRTLTTPGLLLLEGVEVEISGAKHHIFTQSKMRQLFASIFSSQIEELVHCNSGICQYSGRLSLGCDRCFTACNHGAIQQSSEGIRVDHKQCVECGACIGACPTGAMQYLRFTDISFIEYISKAPFKKGMSVVIGTEKTLHGFWWRNQNTSYTNTFFLEYPHCNALSPMHFLSLLELGAGRIIVLNDPEPVQINALQDSMALVNEICKALFDQGDTVARVSRDELHQTLTGKEAQAILPPRNDKGFSHRRDKITTILTYMMEQSGKTATFHGEAFVDFGTVACDQEKCTLCLACLNACSIESLFADSENFSLMHLASRCVQCGACVQVCPEDALSLVPGLQLDQHFHRESELAKTERMACAGCGKIFGSKKSYDRIMQVLGEKNMLDENSGLFKYCEKCRVIKIFEQNQND